MSSSGVNLEKYRIPLQDIIRATNNFSSETQIGDGGFGMVYKGQLSDNGQIRTVAIKRLNQNGYQGNNEFHNEVDMVSSFDHPNISTFIGYCDEANEMIIVYDYAINKSLDLHLQDPDKRRCITWSQRLQICLGAARGLRYLHSGLGEDRRVIHRDVKSANILLDVNLQAKICDFGLSRFGPRNQDHTHLLTRPAGTMCYMDPVCTERSRLSKESDVYSFGVVLFEMSSGMLAYDARCFVDDMEQYLLDLVRSYYDDYEVNGLDKLIDPLIKDDINMRSFHIFNEIAHQCINLDSKKRPTMDRIIHEIEKALDIQDHGPVDQPMTHANGAPSVVDPLFPHVHSPFASDILEDLLSPLAIEDRLSSYTIKPTRDIAESFYALCLKDSGVLYEDPYIQIGIKAEWQNHQGRLSIFLGNKNTTATLDSVQAVILPQSHLKLEHLLVPEIIPPQKQIKCQLEVVILHPSRDVAFLDFSYKFGTQLVNNILRLPTVLNKFLNPIQVSTEEYFSKWRSLAGPPLKLQEVVRDVRPMSLEELEILFNRLRLIVYPGLDPNKYNLVASTTFYSESTRDMLCLVRIETYPADRTRIRITVASKDPTLTFELKKLIKEHLVRIPR